MKNKFLSALLLVACTLCCGFLFVACDNELKNNNEKQVLHYELDENGEGYIVTGLGNVTETDIVIPSIYSGLSVTAIGERAFGGCSSLTSVTIPDSVTSFGYYAFDGCSSLTSIAIPDRESISDLHPAISY